MKNVVTEKEKYIKTMQSRIYFLSEKLTKALHRRGGKTLPKARSNRQKQLLKEVDSPRAPALPGSRLVSTSFQQVRRTNGHCNPLTTCRVCLKEKLSLIHPMLLFVSQSTDHSSDLDDSLDDNQADDIDPAYIWNAELREAMSNPTARSPRLQAITYKNKDPLRLDGKRSNRTSNVSTQFVP